MNIFLRALIDFIPFIPLWVVAYIVFKRFFKIQRIAAQAYKNLADDHFVQFYHLSLLMHAMLQHKAKTTELLPEEKVYFQRCHNFIDFFEKNFRPAKSTENETVSA